MSFWELVLLIVLFMALFTWVGILVTIVGDVMRDHELSGWGKAGWTLILLVIPWLGALVYMIVRGGSMNERARDRAQRDAQESSRPRRRIERAGGASTADEIGKLVDLRDQGTLSAEEFQQAKATLLQSSPR